MSSLLTTATILGSGAGFVFSLASQGIQRITVAPGGMTPRYKASRMLTGALLGAILFGTSAAVLSNDNVQSGLKETFSIGAQPIDIEKCAAAAPQGSTVHFTRNADGSSACTYEMN